MESEIVKLGEVGVDSGQLIICDPSYLDGEFLRPDSGKFEDHAHEIYRHVDDGKLWQYTYGGEPSMERVNKMPSSYEGVIPEYGATVNELILNQKLVKTDFDPTPHIPNGEFSYRGICKATDSENKGGQLNYAFGQAGVAVAFSSGMGDGTYEVFAEIITHPFFGRRVKKVWVEFLTDEDFEEE